MKTKEAITNRQAPRLEMADNIKPWPSVLQISFTKGIVWTSLITMEGVFLWDLLYPDLNAYFSLSPVGNEIFSLFIKVANIAIVFGVLSKLGKFRIRRMVFFQSPAAHVYAKWGFIGLCLTLHNLPFYFPLGVGAQHTDFIMEYVIAIFYYGILSPLKEEVVFRGLLYGAIRTSYGKMYAFLFSVIVFILVHSEFWELIEHGNWNLLGVKLSFFVIVSVVLAHIYESTHSLLLCMGFHGAVNMMHNVSPLLGYLYDGYLIVPVAN